MFLLSAPDIFSGNLGIY